MRLGTAGLRAGTDCWGRGRARRSGRAVRAAGDSAGTRSHRASHRPALAGRRPPRRRGRPQGSLPCRRNWSRELHLSTVFSRYRPVVHSRRGLCDVLECKLGALRRHPYGVERVSLVDEDARLVLGDEDRPHELDIRSLASQLLGRVAGRVSGAMCAARRPSARSTVRRRIRA